MLTERNEMRNEKKYLSEEESFQRFIEFINPRKDVYKYLHNTEEKAIADKIILEGFDFESHLDYTTDLVTGNDPIEIKYFFIKRKRYGLYTIIIEISKSIVDYYSQKLSSTPFHFSEVLTCQNPLLSDNDEPLYRLPSQFIKGYYDHEAQKPIPNETFDPFFHSEKFDQNLKQFLQE
jgi:hypothetical protein